MEFAGESKGALARRPRLRKRYSKEAVRGIKPLLGGQATMASN